MLYNRNTSKICQFMREGKSLDEAYSAAGFASFDLPPPGGEREDEYKEYTPEQMSVFEEARARIRKYKKVESKKWK